MKTFEVHFIISGKPYKEVATGENTYKVKQLIRLKYKGAKITAIYEVR